MKAQLEASIATLITRLFGLSVAIELTRPDEQFGDYATNTALQLAKPVGQSPRQIAEQIAHAISSDLGDIVSDVSVAGPGFINLKLTDQALTNLAIDSSASSVKQEFIIETNNPNPFKAMHIGHAFNAIIADTLANLLAADGNQVHRVSYHGDVGSHVGKSMYSLLRYIDGDPSTLLAIEPNERNGFMSKMYADGAAAYKDNPEAKQTIDELAKQSFTLEDPVYRAVYETCKAWSFEQIDAIVTRLGNQPIERRYLESAADDLGVATVKQHVPAVFQESEGALVFAGSQHGSFDNVFVSRHGRGLYGARDLGLMQLKANDFPKASASYIVTAEEQRAYFVGVIAAASLCGLKTDTRNISTGTVKLSTGKMSSRTGEVVEIGWLFDRIGEAIQERGGEATDDIVAGALRYQFLKVRIGSDVVFDVSEAVSLQGNSGSYLQYAHARACSILSKAGNDYGELKNLEADERSLLRKISEYPEVRQRSITELMPHHICGYLYELAQSFNRFYEHNRVVGHDRQAVRLALVHAYAETLRTGLGLLGIPAPDSM